MQRRDEMSVDDEEFALCAMLELVGQTNTNINISDDVVRNTAKALLRSADNNVVQAMQMWDSVVSNASQLNSQQMLP